MFFNLFIKIAQNNEKNKNNKCEILGWKSIILQVFLAITSFSILIIKRYYERPQRPLKIWFFDVSVHLFQLNQNQMIVNGILLIFY